MTKQGRLFKRRFRVFFPFYRRDEWVKTVFLRRIQRIVRNRREYSYETKTERAHVLLLFRCDAGACNIVKASRVNESGTLNSSCTRVGFVILYSYRRDRRNARTPWYQLYALESEETITLQNVPNVRARRGSRAFCRRSPKRHSDASTTRCP